MMFHCHLFKTCNARISAWPCYVTLPCISIQCLHINFYVCFGIITAALCCTVVILFSTYIAITKPDALCKCMLCVHACFEIDVLLWWLKQTEHSGNQEYGTLSPPDGKRRRSRRSYGGYKIDKNTLVEDEIKNTETIHSLW